MAMLKDITLIKTKYKHINKRIADETTFKTILKGTFGALVISIAIIAIPALLVYNLFVFHKIQLLLKIIVIGLVWAFSFLYNYLYDQLLKNYHDKLTVLKTKTLVITDSIISGIILTIFAVVIMSLF